MGSCIGGSLHCSEWRIPIGCLKLQVIFRKRATNSRALSRKIAYSDKTSYGSSPPYNWGSLHCIACLTSGGDMCMFLHIHVYVYIYICMYMYMYTYIYMYMGSCIGVSLHCIACLTSGGDMCIFIYIYASVYTYIYIYVYVYVYIYIYTYVYTRILCIYTYTHVYICIHIYIYIYIQVHNMICFCICTHTHIFVHRGDFSLSLSSSLSRSLSISVVFLSNLARCQPSKDSWNSQSNLSHLENTFNFKIQTGFSRQISCFACFAISICSVLGTVYAGGDV